MVACCAPSPKIGTFAYEKFVKWVDFWRHAAHPRQKSAHLLMKKLANGLIFGGCCAPPPPCISPSRLPPCVVALPVGLAGGLLDAAAGVGGAAQPCILAHRLVADRQVRARPTSRHEDLQYAHPPQDFPRRKYAIVAGPALPLNLEQHEERVRHLKSSEMFFKFIKHILTLHFCT